jgi:hypothetical protein
MLRLAALMSVNRAVAAESAWEWKPELPIALPSDQSEHAAARERRTAGAILRPRHNRYAGRPEIQHGRPDFFLHTMEGSHPRPVPPTPLIQRRFTE